MLDLLASYRTVRDRTVSVAARLAAEHCEIQPLPDTRSVAWHLGHTSWFFERFVLANTNTLGEVLCQPVVDSMPAAMEHRFFVDERIARALNDNVLDRPALAVLEHGLHHEQQHQELILTDAKLALALSRGQPAYRTDLVRDRNPTIAPFAWVEMPGDVIEIGASEGSFAFPQEQPRHRVEVAPFALANRPIANAEVLAFIGDGGYEHQQLWSEAGLAAVRRWGWYAPLYWFQEDGGWFMYDLGGVREVDPAETACHLSYFEAEAIARWAGARLPTEIEWEYAARNLRPRDGHWADDDRLHPRAASTSELSQLFGDVWEWTSSAYGPYPGSQPPSIAVSSTQHRGDELDDCSGNVVPGHMVVRGGSCLTPRGHVRASYRKSLPLSSRWHMTGVRLAHPR